MKKKLKSNYKIIIGIIIGILICGGVSYAVNIASSSVSYTKSGSSVNTFEGALNELYEKSAVSNMCIVTQVGLVGWYAKYICDGQTGVMKECYYTGTEGATTGGTLCDKTFHGCLYYTYENGHLPNLYNHCSDSLPNQYRNGGGMSTTISCSCS